jgi:hypothetical protein
VPLLPADQPVIRELGEAARAEIDAGRFGAAWAAGSAMSLNQAVELALHPS